MKSATWINVQHAPVGAFASFTLGCPGPTGGLGLELGGPARESIFIGVERADGNGYDALPFFGSSADSARRYDVSADAPLKQGRVSAISPKCIERTIGLGTDIWQAGDLIFTIYSAPKKVPDPKRATRAEMMAALVPAVLAELTLDNRSSNRPREVFFGYEGSLPGFNTRRLDDVSGGRFTGIGQGPATAIVSATKGVFSGTGFVLDAVLEPDFPENLAFGLGGVGALMAEVPAGTKRSFRFAICFYRDGVVTSGLPMRYYYTRYFPSIERVAEYALSHFAVQKKLALDADRTLERARLSPTQKFHVAHAVHSYMGSTQFLMTADGQPFWAVNEGEYRMINTFDLTVDHLYFETDRNPWVVRNQLDWFVKRYSYRDRVRLPGDSTEYPGGLSFTHDMGIGNCLSRLGYSSYEKFGLTGCFSHMTHEQLVNWVCCAVTYVRTTGDTTWLEKNLPVFRSCLTSLINRDHPDPAQRDGIMGADSSRCLGGSEITTYDSLDASLGQARNNLYLAVKTWAAYVGLHLVFSGQGKAAAATKAWNQALRCAKTICAHQTTEGFIPAILGEGNTAKIIPGIEGLVFLLTWKQTHLLGQGGPFAALGDALRRHLDSVLRVGICRFPDGGWKLSSTNDNSWLSKIYLCQHVAREIFAYPADTKADAAHAAWLTDKENSFFAWSDQMVAGKAQGSKYYPRGVTSWLWLREQKK